MADDAPKPNYQGDDAPTLPRGRPATPRSWRDRETEKPFARQVAEEVVSLLEERGTLRATGISSRRREEVDAWRERTNMESVSTDPTRTDESSDSSWSVREARRLLASMRQKKKPSR
jgi:hypothetical protein